jgi:hypothetical protein
MARPLTPQEATEMIMALRRQQGGGSSYPSGPGRRGKRAGSDPAKTPRREAEAPRETGTEE